MSDFIEAFIHGLEEGRQMDEKQYSRRACLRAAAAGGIGAVAVAGTRPAQAANSRVPEVKIAGYAYDRARDSGWTARPGQF